MRILVTGSVGSGKTTVTKMLCEELNDFASFNLSDVIINNKLYEKVDEEFDTHIADDDKLMEYIRSNINPIPNFIIDHHSFDIFGNVYFDVVVVVSCIDKDGKNLWTLRKRLVDRGYSEMKIQENLAVEMMGHIKDEVRRFKCIKLQILNNGTPDELRQAVKAIADQIKSGNLEVLETLEGMGEEEYEEYEEVGDFE